jgi:hypothetical protein
MSVAVGGYGACTIVPRGATGDVRGRCDFGKGPSSTGNARRVGTRVEARERSDAPKRGSSRGTVHRNPSAEAASANSARPFAVPSDREIAGSVRGQRHGYEVPVRVTSGEAQGACEGDGRRRVGVSTLDPRKRNDIRGATDSGLRGGRATAKRLSAAVDRRGRSAEAIPITCDVEVPNHS